MALAGAKAAVGPSYYSLARVLWDPSDDAVNASILNQEYYSAYGSGASAAMEMYFDFWRTFGQRTYTNPAVLAQIAAYENKSSPMYMGAQRAQHVKTLSFTDLLFANLLSREH